MMILLPLLLTGAFDQIDDQMSAWDRCLRSRAASYAALGEPAETIATATISACKAQEWALRNSGTNDADARPVRDKIIDGMVATHRAEIIQLVMDQRLARKR